MRLRLRSDRLLLGFRGLGLLRGWPFQDPAEAASQIEAIARISSNLGNPEDFDVDVLDADEAFLAWSEVYDASVNPLIAGEERTVRAFLEAIVPGKALDLASGTGRLARFLRNEVVAMDGSLGMLRRARADRAPEPLVCADLHRLPFQDACFDLVVCGLSLTHVRELGRPIAEIARVVRPGGRVVLSDIHPLAVATGAHAFFRREDGSRAVTRNEIHWPSAYVESIRAAGLMVERLAEPVSDGTLLERVSEPDLRSAMELGVLGLPFVLVWLLSRPSVGGHAHPGESVAPFRA